MSYMSDRYGVSNFGGMASDVFRVNAYAAALEKAITPESVVVDIGAGTGIFSLVACRFGAKHVYAIEPDDAVLTGREIAAANGYADRITFIHDISTHVTLPEQADVMVSDLRGSLPLYNQHLESIIDARTRLLKPGGTQIPQRDTLYFAGVNAPKIYEDIVEPWAKNPFGFDMSAGRRYTVNTYGHGRAKPEEIVLPAQEWAVLDYTTLTELNYHSTLRWQVDEPTAVNGLQGWFHAVLLDDIGYVTSPDQPELAYGTTFFPLMHPVLLNRGDTLSVDMRADDINGTYTWTWITQVRQAGTDEAVLSFKQSSFFGSLPNLQRIHMRAASYQPKLNEKAKIDKAILEWMADGLTVGAIAQRLREQYPKYANPQDALAKAADMAQYYSE